MTPFQRAPDLLLRRHEAVGTGEVGREARILLLGDGERRLTAEAHAGAGFPQIGSHAHALIKHEAFALVVGAPALLEVFQDAAVELEHVAKPFALHERPRLFAADPAGAEHDDGRLLQRGRETLHRFGEVAKMIHTDGQRPGKGAHADLVLVPRVEQRDGASLVQPLLQRFRGKLRGGPAGGIDLPDAEGDNLLFQPDQHPVKGHVFRLAELGREAFEAGPGAQLGKQALHRLPGAGDEEIDALVAEQDGPLEIPLQALPQQRGLAITQIRERRELVRGNIGDRGGGSLHPSVTRP